MKPAVVLSAHVMGLAVVRGLGSAGVPVVVGSYDERDMGTVSRYVRERISLPHPQSEEAGFVAKLLAWGERSPGAVLFPADDAVLCAVARHKSTLSEVFSVACTGWDTAERFIRKQNTYAVAHRIGVPAPLTYVVDSSEEALARAKEVGYPCLVKPCESHLYFERFRRKMVRVDHREDLLRAFGAASAAGLAVMVQELVEGGDDCGINYNCLMIEGEPAVEFTARKVRLSPPHFGVPRVLVSRKVPEVMEPGRAILKALGFSGFACTEFKRDARTGVYKLMEVNGRHNRSGMLAIRCGINFPLLEYEYLASGVRPHAAGFRDGVYWIDDIKDVVDSVRYHRMENYGFSELARPYFGRKVFAVLAWNDLRPWFKRCLDVVKGRTPGAAAPPLRDRSGPGESAAVESDRVECS
jgi:predicted ATP-grasp superfamily ATP-dependent carboligase